MKPIYYCYDMTNPQRSFSMVAERHIEALRKAGFAVTSISTKGSDEFTTIHQFSFDRNAEPGLVILHPLDYGLLSDACEGSFPLALELIQNLAGQHKVMACVVADSDKMTPFMDPILEHVSALVTPSEHSKKVWASTTLFERRHIHVVPHGLSDAFLSDVHPEPQSHQVQMLADWKNNEPIKTLLYFCGHSEFRKGIDHFMNIAITLAEVYGDKFMPVIVTKPELKDKFLALDRKMFMLYWMSESDLIATYDLADAVIVPSRSGGFEMNALEAVARFKHTFVTNGGPFADTPFVHRCAPSSRTVIRALMGNPYHIGQGHDISEKSAYLGIRKVFDGKMVPMESLVDRSDLVDNFSWDVVGKQFAEVVSRVLKA